MNKSKHLMVLGFLLSLIGLISFQAKAQHSTKQGGYLTYLPYLHTPIDALSFELVVNGLTMPTVMAFAPADNERMFIAERAGKLRIVEDGDLLPTPYLNISDRVLVTTEGGLLGMTFHPDYANNGYVFVNYTNLNGNTVVSRFTENAGNSNTADPDSEKIIIQIPQPEGIHNAGDIHFSPNDGYLYIATGDGGPVGDPNNNSQGLETLLGKILRIDVNTDEPYIVPDTNPFVHDSTILNNEIWAYGLRNPWRFSFDQQTGDLFISDVGEGLWEEVNYQPANDGGGQNYGWRCYEGNQPFTQIGCPADGWTFPVHVYPHDTGTETHCAIVGGYVYRGSEMTDLQGSYFFADFCSTTIWQLTNTPNGWQAKYMAQLANNNWVAFGQDPAGEMYAMSLGGAVYKLVP
jgi:glucose/arabinose dehydrogenase